MTAGSAPTPDELARRVRELEAAVEARDSLIAVAAHELRSPLSTMVLSVRNLRSALDDYHAPSIAANALNALDRAIDHFSQRAAVLLDITRLSSGNYRFEPESVDLDVLVRNVAAVNAPSLNVAHCELHLDLHAVQGCWDRFAIEQVATNLLSNAMKYGAGKPITIRVRRERTEAVLSVRDEGVGISEDDQARIFEKFERAFRRSEFGGFGLGLWIVGQIVRAHGGRIEVTSSINRGSEFVVWLPIT